MMRILLLLLTLSLIACSGDERNKLSRLGVEYLDGDYKITYAVHGFTRTWQVKGGKITSEPNKGYYFFWALDEHQDKFYVQVPIAHTIIEEIH